jgi:hypothetical protein
MEEVTVTFEDFSNDEAERFMTNFRMSLQSRSQFVMSNIGRNLP